MSMWLPGLYTKSSQHVWKFTSILFAAFSKGTCLWSEAKGDLKARKSKTSFSDRCRTEVLEQHFNIPMICIYPGLIQVQTQNTLFWEIISLTFCVFSQGHLVATCAVLWRCRNCGTSNSSSSLSVGLHLLYFHQSAFRDFWGQSQYVIS